MQMVDTYICIESLLVHNYDTTDYKARLFLEVWDNGHKLKWEILIQYKEKSFCLDVNCSIFWIQWGSGNTICGDM